MTGFCNYLLCHFLGWRVWITREPPPLRPELPREPDDEESLTVGFDSEALGALADLGAAEGLEDAGLGSDFGIDMVLVAGLDESAGRIRDTVLGADPVLGADAGLEAAGLDATAGFGAGLRAEDGPGTDGFASRWATRLSSLRGGLLASLCGRP